MQNTVQDKPRTVIPRWRAISKTPVEELQSSLPATAELPWKSHISDWQIAEWRSEKSLESSIDMLDYGVMIGDERTAIEGAAGILSRASEAPFRVTAAARRAMQLPSTPSTPSFIEDVSIGGHQGIRSAIRRSKLLLSQFPRNSLIHCEIGRQYALLGASRHAERHLLTAVTLAPDNRYILRSITSFFAASSDTGAALPFLRRAEGFERDNWLLSAELAAAQLAGKSTKIPKAKMRDIRAATHIPRSGTELASGLAWLEHENGVKRRQIGKIIKAASFDPTENALAQSIWVSEQVGLDDKQLIVQAKTDPLAWEARASAYFESGDYVRSEQEGSLWFEDQPLEARAALQLAFTNLLQLENYKRAADISARAAELHYDDWSVQNCAMISHAYAGYIVDARNYLRHVNRHSTGENEAAAFVAAGEGLLNFMAGNIDDGRRGYEEATRIAQMLKRPELMLNAVVFWLEQEVMNGSILCEELKEIAKNIERSLKRLPTLQAREIRSTFEARMIVMNRVCGIQERPPNQLVANKLQSVLDVSMDGIRT